MKTADDTLALPEGCTEYMVCWGLGVDSSAILARLATKGCRPPQAIVFSDPGHEWPESYAWRETFSDWLVARGFPRPITIRRPEVIKTKRVETLGEECERLNEAGKAGLPSVAFGWHKCSMKHKAEPINAWAKKQGRIASEVAAGRTVAKVIGYDAGENSRARSSFKDKAEAKMFSPSYLLREWGWTRADCISYLEQVAGSAPKKSACTFCPHNTDNEWRQLAADHPDLFDYALRLEAGAMPAVQKPEVVGLRRRGKKGDRSIVEWAKRESLCNAECGV